MNAATQSPVILDRFDLLPPSFRYRIRIRQVLCSWLTIVCTLIALLGGVSTATMLGMHRDRQMNQQIASTAVPLMQLRRDVLRLQDENTQRNQWCRSVEASRPDDNALQTLAAIAVASHAGDEETMIDSLHLRLPVEFPSTAKQTPIWAVPRIAISARFMTEDAVQRWVDRLNRIDRLESASVAADTNASVVAKNEINGGISHVQLTATPLATRVLP